MNLHWTDFVAPVATTVAFAAVLSVLFSERHAFREAVIGWERHDLSERAELAAATLREPLDTGDFAAIHEVGAKCAADGIRLTINGPGGGLVFDSVRGDSSQPESVYESRPSGEWRVRLGMPLERVLAPYSRAGYGFILAALAGAVGVFLVFFSTYRQRVRYKSLERTERFRREFIADISHELKTPLTGIIGAVDLISDGGMDRETELGLLRMVKDDSVRLNDLAQNIIDLARLEREGVRLARSDTDLSELVRTESDRLAPIAEKSGVRLDVSLPDGPCVASVDAQLVAHALSNLVVNAIRHSGAKSVLVSLERTRGGAKISVEDHGKGIPPEERERVFERFYRVDKSRESAGGGLGLAIVRRIARMHGGDATLSPATPCGCRFTVTFP